MKRHKWQKYRHLFQFRSTQLSHASYVSSQSTCDISNNRHMRFADVSFTLIIFALSCTTNFFEIYVLHYILKGHSTLSLLMCLHLSCSLLSLDTLMKKRLPRLIIISFAICCLSFFSCFL